MPLVGVRMMKLPNDGDPVPTSEFRLQGGEAVLVSGEKTFFRLTRDEGVDLHQGDANVAVIFGERLGVKMPAGPGKYDVGDGARFLVAVLAQFKHGSRAWAEPIME